VLVNAAEKMKPGPLNEGFVTVGGKIGAGFMVLDAITDADTDFKQAQQNIRDAQLRFYHPDGYYATWTTVKEGGIFEWFHTATNEGVLTIYTLDGKMVDQVKADIVPEPKPYGPGLP
jgi:hypothetical protein